MAFYRNWFVAFALVLLAAPAAAQQPAASIESISIYPTGSRSFNKLAGFVWPDVTSLDLLMEVELSGLDAERKVDVFVALKDEDGEVVDKFKQNHILGNGTSPVLIEEILNTADFYGKRTFRLEIEVDMPGTKPVQDEFTFDLTGPPPPDVRFHKISLFNPEAKFGDDYFEPGDPFVLEAVFEIVDNPANAYPMLLAYGYMEEEYFQNGSNMSQHYEQNWDQVRSDFRDGKVRVFATGWLPRYFEEPHEFEHPFSIYLAVDFGPGAAATDFARAVIYDYDSGDHRQADEIEDRLIEMDKGYHWVVERPGDRRRWDERDLFR